MSVPTCPCMEHRYAEGRCQPPEMWTRLTSVLGRSEDGVVGMHCCMSAPTRDAEPTFRPRRLPEDLDPSFRPRRSRQDPEVFTVDVTTRPASENYRRHALSSRPPDPFLVAEKPVCLKDVHTVVTVSPGAEDPMQEELITAEEERVLQLDESDEEPLPEEYEVECSKDDADSGLEVEHLNGMLLVTRLGPMKAWNARCKRAVRVRQGDRILGINGKEGDCRALFQELRSNSRLRLRMRHAKEFCVFIDRGDRELGMEVMASKVKIESIKIRAISKGAVDDYNKSGEGEPIMVGDRIINVNGIVNNPPGMFHAIQEHGRIYLTLIRPN